MAQQRSATALEPYLALAPSATSPRAAADLITQATSAQHAYSFAELLQKPNIQKLRTAEPESYRGYLKILEIFAWGTWQDYTSTPNLPKLNTAQEQKLRLLSLLSLVSSNISSPSTPTSTTSATSSSSTIPTPSNPTLSYLALQAALSLPNPSALESLTTAAIHAETLFATLDPAAGVIAVRSVAPVRDLPPGSIPVVKATTDAWITRCEDVVKELEGKVEDIMTKARERARREADLQRRLDMAVDKGDLKGTRGEESGRTGIGMDARVELERERSGIIGRDSGLGGGGNGTDEMDIDDAGGIAGSSGKVRPRASR